MTTIQAEQLTRENFQNFGSYQNLLDISDRLEKWEDGESGFFPDLVQLNFGGGNPACASVCRVLKQDGAVIDFTEFHKYTAEGILPLDGDCVIYVGKNYHGVTSAKLLAFRVPKGTFVSLRAGVLHGKQIVFDQEAVHVLILLPEHTYENDCEIIRFSEEDYVQVIV